MKLKTNSTFLLVLFVAFAYAVLGALGLTLAIPPGYASPVFPASGLALAFVLQFKRRALPGVWLGSFLLNLANSWLHGTFSLTIVAMTAVLASGAAIQAWAGSWMVKRWKGESWRHLDREQNAFGFLLRGGVLACLMSASISVTGLLLAGAIAPAEYLFTWWNWYVGDTLGVLVFAPLTVILFFDPDNPLGRQRLRIVAPMLLILGLVTLAFFGTARWEKQSQDNQIQADGGIVAKQIADRLITHREVLASLRNFVEAIDDFSFAQFEQFTLITLRDNPDIFALSLNDLITENQRTGYEAKMSALSPLGSFRITERDSQARLIRAASRPEYVPVRYIVPLSGNKPAVGFDIHSEPIRRDAIARATGSGGMSVTSPIQLVQEQKKRVAVLELLPIKGKLVGGLGNRTTGLPGFAVSVVKVDEMVEIATRGHVPAGLVFQLADPHAPQGANLLYRSDSGSSSSQDRRGGWKTTLRMGDREWELLVSTTEMYRLRHRPWMAWAVGVLGLILTALLQLLIYGIVGRAAEIQEKKEARTAQELAEVTSRALEARVAEEVGKNREKDVLMLQQDKLASIGLLAAGVAHEINNPMGFIMSNLKTLKGYVENLGQYTSLLQALVSREGSNEGQHMAGEASEKLDIPYILDDIGKLVAGSSGGAERVKRIVTDLRNFSRSDEAQFMETDLNQCIQSTANVVHNEIKYVAELEFNLGDIPHIICNPQQINQVVANLLVNAAQAIDGFGYITVTTSSEGEQVVMTVADTGRGIPERFRGRVFDPFFTTKDVGKGTGLGLSISYGIIKKHFGTIGFETESGVGTTFTVRLPVRGPE